MIRRKLLVVAAGTMLSHAAAAQDSVTNFRFTAAPDNIQGCIALDSSFTRVHTLTVKDGVVQIKSAGGIDDKMKRVKPGLYQTTFQLGGGHINFVLDAKARTLTATSQNLGCKWNGVPEP